MHRSGCSGLTQNSLGICRECWVRIPSSGRGRGTACRFSIIDVVIDSDVKMTSFKVSVAGLRLAFVQLSSQNYGKLVISMLSGDPHIFSFTRPLCCQNKY